MQFYYFKFVIVMQHVLSCYTNVLPYNLDLFRLTVHHFLDCTNNHYVSGWVIRAPLPNAEIE